MPDLSTAEARPLINALTPKQRDVLGCVAMCQDGGHHPRTLEALERKGLLESHEQRLPGHPPMTITRYSVPIPVHIAYCEWASENVSEEDEL